MHEVVNQSMREAHKATIMSGWPTMVGQACLANLDSLVGSEEASGKLWLVSGSGWFQLGFCSVSVWFPLRSRLDSDRILLGFRLDSTDHVIDKTDCTELLGAPGKLLLRSS